MLTHCMIVSTVTLILLSSCNSSRKINQSETIQAKTLKDNEDSQLSTETQPDVLASNEIDEDEENQSTALEPVPIGGAFLSCQYQNGQAQGSESYRMDCDLAPAIEVKTPLVDVAFHKIDAQGNRYALSIVSQDLSGLKWTVEENAATLPYSQVQMVIHAPGFLSVTLASTIKPGFNLVPNTNYWLGGEPNNQVSNGENENCVEFISASAKDIHRDVTGFASGPLGRLNDAICSQRINFLCRNVSAEANARKWVLSATTGTFAEGAQACAAGYAFAFPLTEAEIREVMAVVDLANRNTWVNMSDLSNKNQWTIFFR